MSLWCFGFSAFIISCNCCNFVEINFMFAYTICLFFCTWCLIMYFLLIRVIIGKLIRVSFLVLMVVGAYNWLIIRARYNFDNNIQCFTLVPFPKVIGNLFSVKICKQNIRWDHFQKKKKKNIRWDWSNFQKSYITFYSWKLLEILLVYYHLLGQLYQEVAHFFY